MRQIIPIVVPWFGNSTPASTPFPASSVLTKPSRPSTSIIMVPSESSSEFLTASPVDFLVSDRVAKNVLSHPEEGTILEVPRRWITEGIDDLEGHPQSCWRFVSVSSSHSNRQCAMACTSASEHCQYQRPSGTGCYGKWIYGRTRDTLAQEAIITVNMGSQSTPQACQDLCQQQDGCESFVFTQEDDLRRCFLLPSGLVKDASRVSLEFPRHKDCLQDGPDCNIDLADCDREIIKQCYENPSRCKQCAEQPTDSRSCALWDDQVISGPRLCGTDEWISSHDQCEDSQAVDPSFLSTVTPETVTLPPLTSAAITESTVNPSSYISSIDEPVEQPMECCDNAEFRALGLGCPMLVGLCDASPHVQANCPAQCGIFRSQRQCHVHCETKEETPTIEDRPEDRVGECLLKFGPKPDPLCSTLCEKALSGDYWTCATDNLSEASECISATFPRLCPLRSTLASDLKHMLRYQIDIEGVEDEVERETEEEREPSLPEEMRLITTATASATLFASTAVSAFIYWRKRPVSQPTENDASVDPFRYDEPPLFSSMSARDIQRHYNDIDPSIFA